MLDSRGRKYIQPIFDLIANIFIYFGFSPTHVTIIACIIGIFASVLIIMGMPTVAVITLWISGILDAVDGTIARKINQKTKWGTFLDILCDRIVEIFIILAIGIIHPEYTNVLLLLVCMIILSLTVFFSTGTLVDIKTEKSFYYQAGLAERTEGFVFFTLMILWESALFWITISFAIIVLYTAGQRIFQLYKFLHQ